MQTERKHDQLRNVVPSLQLAQRHQLYCRTNTLRNFVNDRLGVPMLRNAYELLRADLSHLGNPAMKGIDVRFLIPLLDLDNRQ